MAQSLWILLTMHMLSMVHLQLSIIRVPKKTPVFFPNPRDGSFLQKHSADMENVHLLFMENSPAAQNDCAEIRRLEPYCYGQFTGESKPTLWTLSCSLAERNCFYCNGRMCGGILGLRPDLEGLQTVSFCTKKLETF